MSQQVDESICPLCQSANLCGVNDPQGCWCAKANVPDGLRAQVPTHLKRKACICQTCIDKYQIEQVKEVR